MSRGLVITDAVAKDELARGVCLLSSQAEWSSMVQVRATPNNGMHAVVCVYACDKHPPQFMRCSLRVFCGLTQNFLSTIIQDISHIQ